MCACVCTDILCLEDYAKMEQEQLKREMKGSKRSCLSDMHQQLACGKKKHQQKQKKQWKQCTKSHHNVLKTLTEQKAHIFKSYMHLYFPLLF